jgi:hypothetical protein
MGRRINDSFAVRKEEPASRPAFAAIQKFDVIAVDIHAKDLIALKRRPGGLENYLIAVM